MYLNQHRRVSVKARRIRDRKWISHFLNKSSKSFHHSSIVFILFWLFFSIFRLPIIVNRYTCLNEIFNNSPLSLFVSPHPSYFLKTAHFCSKLLMAKCMNRKRCCSLQYGESQNQPVKQKHFFLWRNCYLLDILA